jgi:hypothetical protein
VYAFGVKIAHRGMHAIPQSAPPVVEFCQDYFIEEKPSHCQVRAAEPGSSGKQR